MKSDFNFPEHLGHGDGFRGSSDLWRRIHRLLERGGNCPAQKRWFDSSMGGRFRCGVPRDRLDKVNSARAVESAVARFGRFLQRLTNPIIMAILFFSTITPFGLIMRLLNRDVLRLKWDRGVASHWIPRRPPVRHLSR